jgi:hypothetical protein
MRRQQKKTFGMAVHRVHLNNEADQHLQGPCRNTRPKRCAVIRLARRAMNKRHIHFLVRVAAGLGDRLTSPLPRQKPMSTARASTRDAKAPMRSRTFIDQLCGDPCGVRPLAQRRRRYPRRRLERSWKFTSCCLSIANTPCSIARPKHGPRMPNAYGRQTRCPRDCEWD